MLAFFVTLGVVVLDQLTKLIVRLSMDVDERICFIPHIMNFTYVENDGAAFGMLDDARWVFLVASTVTIVVIVWFLHKHGSRHPLLTTSLSFILGGGIGNMIDRLFVTNAKGEYVVTDFLETAFMKFAVFNVADSFITVGAILLGVYVIFIEPKVEKRIKEAEKASNDDEDSEMDEYDGNDGSDN